MKASKTSAPSLPLGIDQITPLLGGISPANFMRKYWQKKPLLIRQAMPGVKPPIERSKLFALAEGDEVESRLIVQTAAEGAKAKKSKKADAGWRLSHGPLSRRSLPPMTQSGWTLLVQGLDLHVPAAYDLLQQFRFVPDARLDDLMISYATDGGGVGPHFDSYDVFLLQVQGLHDAALTQWPVNKVSVHHGQIAGQGRCHGHGRTKSVLKIPPAADLTGLLTVVLCHGNLIHGVTLSVQGKGCSQPSSAHWSSNSRKAGLALATSAAAN